RVPAVLAVLSPVSAVYSSVLVSLQVVPIERGLLLVRLQSPSDAPI
ncbi:hypothetical protein Tco_1498311, partial [Tanacetum coccineum]